MQFGISEFGSAIDGNEQIKSSFFSADFGNINVKIADWILLKLFLGWLVAADIRQLADAVAFQAVVQGRAGQIRNAR